MKTPRHHLARVQSREAVQLVRHFANRAAKERTKFKANPNEATSFGMYLAYRSAAWLAAKHFKRHDLFPKP
ncbi:MAG: hypothetical protein WCO56_25170 [Verrucomicrobiota bacterium]